MKKKETKKLRFRRVKKFKKLIEMTNFIEKNHIKNFDSNFLEAKQVYVLHY